MDPSRFVLSDRQWLAIEPLCPGGLTAPGRTGADTRLFLEHFRVRMNRKGFPFKRISDSSCVLGEEASMHGSISFRRPSHPGDPRR